MAMDRRSRSSLEERVAWEEPSGKRRIWIIILVAILVATAGIGIVQLYQSSQRHAAEYGWGDNIGGRTTYTLADIEQNRPEGAVLNSLKDDAQGDNERAFVTAALVDSEGNFGPWQNGEIAVQDGEVYCLRAHVHNIGTESSLGTRVAFNIPTETANLITPYGFVFSDNGVPGKCWHGLSFSAKQDFHLEYIYNRASLSSEPIGQVKLDDAVVTKAKSENGTAIGYDSLNGELPSGAEAFVTIQVRIVIDELHKPDEMNFTTDTKVRLLDEKEWSKTVEIEGGDFVEVQFQYLNCDSLVHQGVIARVDLPEGMELVPGTTKLYNVAYPDGVSLEADTVDTGGVMIGNYYPDVNAFVRCTVKVNSAEDTEILASFTVAETTMYDSCELSLG